MTEERPALLSRLRFWAPTPLQIIFSILFVFSIARYFVDGFALEMMGRSLSQGGDFGVYYVAGLMLRRGEDIYDWNLMHNVAQQELGADIGRSLGFWYPPPLAIAMAPMSLLPYRLAYRLWVLGEQVCLFTSLVLLARTSKALGKWGLPLLVAVAANMWPVYLAIMIGQVNMLILLVLCLALYLARENRFMAAGVVLGLGAMIKLSPALLVVFFLLQRRWRVATGAFLSVAALTVASVLIAGPQSIGSFFQASLGQAIPSQVDWQGNLSAAALIGRFLPPANYPLASAGVRWGLTSILLVALAALSLKQLATSGVRFSLLYGLWLAAMLLVSPITREDHLVWLIPAFWVACTAIVGAQNRFAGWLTAALGLIYTLAAFENLPLNRYSQWAFQTGWWIFSGEYLRADFFSDVRLVSLLGLSALLVILYRRYGRTEASTAPAARDALAEPS